MNPYFILRGLVIIISVSIPVFIFLHYTNIVPLVLEKVYYYMDIYPNLKYFILITCLIILVLSVQNIYSGLNDPCAIGWPIREYSECINYNNYLDSYNLTHSIEVLK